MTNKFTQFLEYASRQMKAQKPVIAAGAVGPIAFNLFSAALLIILAASIDWSEHAHGERAYWDLCLLLPVILALPYIWFISLIFLAFTVDRAWKSYRIYRHWRAILPHVFGIVLGVASSIVWILLAIQCHNGAAIFSWSLSKR